MEQEVDKLYISIGLNTKAVAQGLSMLSRQLGSGLKGIVANVVLPIMTSIVSADFIRQFTEEIGQVDRLSKALGMNIAQLDAWRGAAEQAGLQAENISDLFANINAQMFSARFDQSGALFTNGIQRGMLGSVMNNDGSLRDTEEYILHIADRLNGLNAQTATAVAKSIGIGDLKMIAFLRQGSAAIKEQIDLAKKFGTFTERDAKVAKELNVALKSTARSMKMLMLPAFRFIAPLLEGFAKGVQFAVEHIEAFTPAIIAAGTALAVYLAPALGKLLVAFGAFMLSPTGLMVAGLIALGIVLEDLIVWLNGGKSAFEDFYKSVFGDTETAKKEFDEFIESAKELIPLGLELLKLAGFLMIVATAFSAISTIASVILPIFGAIGASFGGLIVGITALIAALFLLYENWDTVFSFVSEKWNSFCSTIKEGVQWLFDKFSAIGNVFSAIKDFKLFGDSKEALPASATANNKPTTNNNADITQQFNYTVYGGLDTNAATQMENHFGNVAMASANGSYA